MDERLYYEDAYLTRFSAQVTERFTYEEQPTVRLSRSAFYPTSGGQPHDTGSLDGTAVVDVQVGADGAVLHLLAEPLSEQTAGVNGVIDWPRRYDHMQQHSGQHLLSQVFFRRLGLKTVSVHFGDALTTVDLDGPPLSAAQLADVETAANGMVWENRPIRAYWVDEEGRARVPLRRAPGTGARCSPISFWRLASLSSVQSGRRRCSQRRSRILNCSLKSAGKRASSCRACGRMSSIPSLPF